MMGQVSGTFEVFCPKSEADLFCNLRDAVSGTIPNVSELSKHINILAAIINGSLLPVCWITTVKTSFSHFYWRV